MENVTTTVRDGVAGRICEDWLREVGFKWHQLERQPSKHWLLWVGDLTAPDGFGCYEDLGIEVAFNQSGAEGLGDWFCWLRADYAGRYTRFLHVRHMRFARDLVALFEGLTGEPWDPTRHIAGSARTKAQAERMVAESERFDRRLLANTHNEVERDDTRGRALPEHLAAHARTHDSRSTESEAEQ